MRRKYYHVIIMILSVVIMLFSGIKIIQSSSLVADEANYIGDMERENQSSQEGNDTDEGDQDTTQEEIIPLEVTGIIRVILMDTGYNSVEHEYVEVSAEHGLEIHYGEVVEYVEPGESYMINIMEVETEDEIYDETQEQVVMGMNLIDEDESVKIYPIDSEDKIIVYSIERSYGNPQYYGMLEIFSTEKDLVIVNELELEQYLQGVLPSEMPASFEMEALKAQAVCARSYAYTHMTSYAYPEYEAHVDDSTAYQVYNNLEENDECNLAIEETAEELLGVESEVVTTYFFSTSSGQTTDVEAWGQVVDGETAYLEGISVSNEDGDYEENLPWYSWSVDVSKNELEALLQENIKDREGVDIGELESIQIVEYGTGDIVLGLEVVGSEETVLIETEYEIRYVLGGTFNSYLINLNDGSEVEWSSILPSAFFQITYSWGTYHIDGGGYGHGIGMSQNGANELAKDGYGYEDILQFFYEGVEIL